MSEAETIPKNELRRGKDLLGLPVYTTDDGRSVGAIDKLFIRPDNLSVPWVGLKTVSLGEHLFISYADFQTVGIDITLVATRSAVHKDIPEDEKKALDTGLSGRAVMTQSGLQVGTLAGFEIETASGNIVAFSVRATAGGLHGFIAAIRDDTVLVPADAIASLGPDAVILGSNAEALFPASIKSPAPVVTTADNQ